MRTAMTGQIRGIDGFMFLVTSYGTLEWMKLPSAGRV